MKLLSSYSLQTTHPAGVIFSCWADPATWPEWDPEVREVWFDGPALLGARGQMRPAAGRATWFTVTAFEPDRVFTNASSLPGAELVFEHIAEPQQDGSDVAVTVSVTGPLSWLWKRILGRSLGESARSSLDGLLAYLDAR